MMAAVQIISIFEPRFSAEVFGEETARALDALLALEGCVSANTLRCGVVVTKSAPFARPTGVSMYEADALTGASTTRTRAA